MSFEDLLVRASHEIADNANISPDAFCACGQANGANPECERCRLVFRLNWLRESLADHEQCAVCKRWRHVDEMLMPTYKIGDDLVCSETCAGSYGKQ